MFKNIWENFKLEFKDKLDNQSEIDNSKFFWEEMKKRNNFKLINKTWSDTVYPDTEWLDWYDVMEAMKEDNWIIISILWDWPYSIYWYKWNQLVHYIEWELYYYDFK